MKNLILILICACGATPTQDTTVSTQAVGGCSASVTPDDGLDDTAAIMSALAAQRIVHLPAGVYDIDMAPIGANGRRVYDMLTLASGQELYGDGSSTVIRFRGDATGQDWHGITIKGDATSLHDLTIDTSALTGTDEQTHAVYMRGPIIGYELHDLHFNHPQRGLPGGDCIEQVGYGADASYLVGGRIHNNAFDHCDRSAVSWHSGVQDLEIYDNTFPDTGDQDIDGEGNGDNADVLIKGNSFTKGPQAQSLFAMQLELVTRATITNNTFDGRGITAYSIDHSSIDHNTITRSMAGSDSVISLIKATTDVTIASNTITRPTSAGQGFVIFAGPHNSGTPVRLSVLDNTLVQQTNADVINTVGMVGLDVERNLVTYSSVANTYMMVDAIASTTVRTDQIVVASNTSSGPLLAGVRVSGSYGGAGSVSATDNTATGMLQGIRCENVNNGNKVLGPVCSSRNVWPTNVCGAAGFVTACP